MVRATEKRYRRLSPDEPYQLTEERISFGRGQQLPAVVNIVGSACATPGSTEKVTRTVRGVTVEIEAANGCCLQVIEFTRGVWV